MEASRDRIPELDLIRLCAALAVVLFHYLGWAQIKGPSQFGWLGVQLFFMISGFVILWSAQGKTLKGFALSRVARLYPTYWVCLAITFIAKLLSNHDIGLWQLLANITMFQWAFKQDNIDSVYWTLAVELKFYLMVGILLFFDQQKHMERWLLIWLTAVIIGLFIPIISKLTLGIYAPFFISGAVLYYIRSQSVTVLRIVTLVVSMILGMYCASSPALLVNYGVKRHGAVFVVISVVVGLHLVFLAIAARKVRLPRWKGWAALGSMTYPLYLIHVGTGRVIWDALPFDGWNRIAVVSSISLAGAALIARYVEQRLCRKASQFLLPVRVQDGNDAPRYE